MLQFRRIGVNLLLVAGMGVLCLAAATFAQGPKKLDSKKDDKQPGSVLRPKWNVKKVAFEMRGKEWRTVFEWLADQSGLPYASSYPPPAGTFTFVNPTIDGKPYEYTLAEAFDFINDMLIIKTKHILIRRDTMITMFPADVELPDTVIPLILLDELPERGNTEIVRTVIRLEGHIAEDVAPRVKSLIGDLGHVTPLAETNELIVRAPVANIRTMLKIFNPIDAPESAHTYTHQCVYIRAMTARTILMESLGAQQVVEKAVGTPGKDGGGSSQRQRTVRPHTVTADRATNTIIVHGPADKIKQAKDVLASIDKARGPEDKGLLKGAAEFKTHDLPSGSAETMIKVLSEAYKDDPSFRISVIGPTRLFINADPQTHWEIGLFVKKDFQPTVLKSEMIVLNRLDALTFAETIKGMVPDSRNNAPYIEADRDNNGIRVRGTDDQIKDVKGIIRAFDENPFPNSNNSRTVILDKGSGATVSEAMFLLMGKMYPDMDIRLFLPSQLDKKIDFKKPKVDKKDEENKAEKKTPIAQMDANKVRELIYLKDKRVLPVGYSAQDDGKQPKEKEQPAKKKGQLMISGFGNRVLLSSDDSRMLDMAQQLIRILVNTEAGPGDFEVVHLRVANAVEIAKIIDEAYNGKAGSGGGGGGSSGGGGGGRGGGGLSLPGPLGAITSLIPGMGGGGAAAGRTENIRIVADPGTNALLIRARPIDMLTIRRLLDQHLDVVNEETLATIKTHVIGPLKHANAADVADLLRQVYAESMKSQASGGGAGGGGGFGGGFNPFGGPRPSETGGSSRPALLTVGVDNHTNSLYVSCPTTLFNDIERLVENVEKSSSEAKQSIKIVSVEGLDPSVVQQAISAVSGQTNAQATRRFGDTGATPTSGAPGAFGTSGRGSFGSGFGGFPGSFGGGGSGVFPGSFGTPGGFPGIGGPGSGGGIRTPGGGGGGTKGGGGPKGRQSRGPDFFGQPVMDDRSANVLYDPSEEQQLLAAEPAVEKSKDVFTRPPKYSVNPLEFTALTLAQPTLETNVVTMIDAKTVSAGTWSANGPNLTLVFPGRDAIFSGRIVRDQIAGTARNRLGQTWNFSVTRVGGGTEFMGQEDLPGFGKLAFRFAPPGPSDTTLNPPRLGVQVEVIPSLGIAILRANTPADLDAAMQILEYLRKEAQGSKVEIKLVAVRFQDPLHITNQLNQFFGRVAFNPSSTVLIGRDTTTIIPTTGPGLLPGGVTQSPLQQQPQTAVPAGNITFLPQPRLSAILVAAPKSRMDEIVEKIHMLDAPNAVEAGLVPFALKRASAVRVAGALNQFLQTRQALGDNPPALSSTRIAYDDGTNTVFIQASPADMADVRKFIEYVDNAKPGSNLDMRVVGLKNAVAIDLAQVLQLAIANGVLTVNPQAASAFGTGGIGGIGGIQGGGGIQGIGGAGGIQQQIGTQTKDHNVIFRLKDGKNSEETNILEDIRVTADARTNSLVVTAPEKTMAMMLALIKDLDMPPAARSEINIFQLKRADATQLANMLQTLFVGTGAAGARAPGAPGGAVLPPGGAAGAAGAQQQRPPITITIQTFTPEGAPIIDLRVTVDERTNSLIVAGSKNDLAVVDTIIDKIENADVTRRVNETVRLRNANAVDIANAINDSYTKINNIYKTLGATGQGTNALQIFREVVVTAEPITNSLIISATPEYFSEVMRQISKLDTSPPQVVISVLIAEVHLTGAEEFGVEFGLQNPLFFTRSLVPGNTSISYATATTAPVNGFALTSGIPSTVPTSSYGGFYFNNPLNSFQTNTSINPASYGVQGLNALGVGKTSKIRSDVSGFVFTAANDTVNVLIRALKVQDRLNVLSRPQIMTLDNQSAVLAIGQDIPINAGSNATSNGLVTTAIARRTIGVTLQVTPRITPDGRITMRVIPEVSSIADTNFPLGNGTSSTALNIQHLETTVTAFDGDTVMLGGLITKKDLHTENKIPWLGDLPGIGAAFRYRSEQREKKELIIIMTPHIVRNREEAEQVLLAETKRVDWNVKDVWKIHGDKSKNCAIFDSQMFNVPTPMPLPQSSRTEPHRIAPGVTPGVDSLPLLPRSSLPSTPQPAPRVLPLSNETPSAPPVPQPQTTVPAALPISQSPATPSVAPAPPMMRPVPAKGGLLKNVFNSWNKPAAPPTTVTEGQLPPGTVFVTETRPAPLPSVVTPDAPALVPPPAPTLGIR